VQCPCSVSCNSVTQISACIVVVVVVVVVVVIVVVVVVVVVVVANAAAIVVTMKIEDESWETAWQCKIVPVHHHH